MLILLRADNNGEGGTLALMALAKGRSDGRIRYVMLLGMIGAALFYGDALITPALSVLSAVEGLEVAAPQLRAICGAADGGHSGRLVRGPIARHGAGRGVFRPGDDVWFLAIAAAGLCAHRRRTGVLAALNPAHGVSFSPATAISVC